MTETKIKPFLNNFHQTFVKHWTRTYNTTPSQEMVGRFIGGLVDWDDIPQVQRLDENRVREYVKMFFNENHP